MKVIKRLTAALLALALCIGLMGSNAHTFTAKAADLVLKVHYHRTDEKYDGWDVWLWEAGKDGAGYPFAKENGEMVATKVITPGTSSVGFIVRTASWTKDVNEDQFIDISEMISGTVHVYIESGVKGYTKKYGDDAVIGVKVSNAGYENGVVTVTMTGEPEDDYNKIFKVKDKNGEIPVSKVTKVSPTVFKLTLSKEFEGAGTYYVTFDNTDYRINIPNVYSTESFETEFTYEGKDLGAAWTKESTTFKVWAPTADELSVNLYKSGDDGSDDRTETLPMKKGEKGVWSVTKTGDLNGTYYTYTVSVGGNTAEVCDPYARTTGANGKRAMVIDLDSTDPEGWEKDKDPNYDMPVNDMIIYELQIRDLSSSNSSGIKNKRRYLGLIETGTKTSNGVAPTGLDHIKELGITHLHILPFYDFGSIDENNSLATFNWGYDPVNYNVPEGSFSTEPRKGEVRVKEVKQMVKGLHDNGISVVMDVVYNHVYNGAEFCFNQLVPGYFSRIDDNGRYSNGSGCGNDTASERSMVRKYIVDSVNYWADEYHIDGFRFDLVGLIDTQTINEIIETVHEKHPNVIFYGEGWTMSTDLTKDNVTLTTQVNSREVPKMAFFSDDMRDTLKGSVFSKTSLGYVSGLTGVTDKLTSYYMADPNWTDEPTQMIQYASCHDNNTLIDRITSSTPDASREEQIAMNNLAAAIYLTAQGIPFMQAGEEMLRTKVDADGSFNSNSYNAPDKVNQLKWYDLENEEYMKVFNYYKGLIAFRKAHSALRMSDHAEIVKSMKRLTGTDDNVIAIEISGDANNEISDGIVVIFNPNKSETEVKLPDGSWSICVDKDNAGVKKLGSAKGSVKVPGISAMVLVKGNTGAGKNRAPFVTAALACLGGLLLIAAGVFGFKRSKNKKAD